MEIFLDKIRQLLPVLGSDLLIPIEARYSSEKMVCQIKGLIAKGARTSNGFVVFKGSKAVDKNRPSASQYIIALKEKLISDGSLKKEKNSYIFTKDVEFTSSSAAGSIIRGGNTDGLIQWKDSSGRTLKEIESS